MGWWGLEELLKSEREMRIQTKSAYRARTALMPQLTGGDIRFHSMPISRFDLMHPVRMHLPVSFYPVIVHYVWNFWLRGSWMHWSRQVEREAVICV